MSRDLVPLTPQARAAIAAHVLERCFEVHWAPPQSPVGWLLARPEIHYARVTTFTIEAECLSRAALYAWLQARGWRWDAQSACWDLPGDSPLWNLVAAFAPQHEADLQTIAAHRAYAARGRPPGETIPDGDLAFAEDRDAVRVYVVARCLNAYLAARTVNLLTVWKCHLRRVIPVALEGARLSTPSMQAWLAENGYTWSPNLGWSCAEGHPLLKPKAFRAFRLQLVQALAAEPNEVPEVA